MLALTPDGKRKLLWMAAMLAPAGFVQGVRMLEGGIQGPAIAGAATMVPESADGESGDEAGAHQPTRAPLTIAQKRAMEFIAGLSSVPTDRSPMDTPDPEPAALSVPNTTPITPIIDAPPEFPRTLVVTAIVGDGESAVAMIAHKLRRVGDEAAPGWRVTAIDARGRKVRFADRSGREVTLEPPTPQD